MAIVSVRRRLLDGLAIGASALCLIHCLLLPVLIVLLPSLTAFLTFPEAVHYWVLAFAIPASIFALIIGYRRHRWFRPTLIVLPGIVLLLLAALAAPTELAETSITVVGALLLAVGHALNWRAVHHSVSTPREPAKG